MRRHFHPVSNLLATFAVTVCLLPACGKGTLTTGSIPSAPSTQSSGNVPPVWNGTCNMKGIPFGAGEGTMVSPYQICTPTQFMSVSQFPNSYYKVTDNIDFNGIDVVAVTAFAGSLDGQNFTLSNLKTIGALVQSNSGTIQNLNLANVNSKGSYRFGALVGINETAGVITQCSMTGVVETNYSSGGLVGVNYGVITGSSANVTISGTDYIGGLVGFNRGTIQNSYSTGTISTSGPTYPSGGLVAFNTQGTITKSYSMATVSGITAIGGLAGENKSGTIQQSYATGTVPGTNKIGGLVGYNNYTAGATTNIFNSYSTAVVSGSSQLGGLVGQNTGNITNVYSTGSVTGGGADIGGLVGSATAGVVSGSYWDTQTSAQAASAAGTGRTTAQMKTQTTFVGWDFTTLWQISAGSYPTSRL